MFLKLKGHYSYILHCHLLAWGPSLRRTENRLLLLSFLKISYSGSIVDSDWQWLIKLFESFHFLYSISAVKWTKIHFSGLIYWYQICSFNAFRTDFTESHSSILILVFLLLYIYACTKIIYIIKWEEIFEVIGVKSSLFNLSRKQITIEALGVVEVRVDCQLDTQTLFTGHAIGNSDKRMYQALYGHSIWVFDESDTQHVS